MNRKEARIALLLDNTYRLWLDRYARRFGVEHEPVSAPILHYS